jgi:hypothetical protein
MAGRKPIPIKAVDASGAEFFYDSVEEFMQSHGPDPVSNIERWGPHSKNALRKAARGEEASYGGWRLSYLIEGGKGKYETIPGTIKTRDEDRYEKPESERREIDAYRQREEDYALMMTGANGDTVRLKSILRRQYLEIGVKIAKRRNGEWEPPKGWKASEDLEFLERIAEVNGIDWKHIADTRTDAEMFTDGINKLVAEGATAAMELVDEELEAIHKQMLAALDGVRKELLSIAREEDAATDTVRRMFESDGTPKAGVTLREEFEGELSEDALIPDYEEYDEGSQCATETGDDVDDREPSGDESCSDDAAGVDGLPGGADRPPAPGLQGE